MVEAPPRPARFFGLDLAWSPRNQSGACAVDGAGRIVDERWLGPDEEVFDWIERRLDGPAVVAIDAPLQVPNETGRRPCEAELAVEYASRKAGPHPSNRQLLAADDGTIRGERLGAALADLGFSNPWSSSPRTLLEVYPHPALIEAFGLGERLPYKAKKGVGVPERRRGLNRLADLLDRLASAYPPLYGPTVTIPDDLRGAVLKQAEDRLDARVCAWVASLWAADPDRVRLFGDPATGHIAVPKGRFPPGIGTRSE